MSNGIFSQEMLDEIDDFGLGGSFSDLGPSFVAIDFETATRNGNSICQVGIAKVEKGQIVSTSMYLVQPPGNDYEQRNIKIHGITPDDTADCEDFAAQWREICYDMECKIGAAQDARLLPVGLSADAFLLFFAVGEESDYRVYELSVADALRDVGNTV